MKKNALEKRPRAFSFGEKAVLEKYKPRVLYSFGEKSIIFSHRIKEKDALDIQKTLGYADHRTFIRNSIVTWICWIDSDPYWGIITPRNRLFFKKSDREWLYWNTKDVRSVLENPCFCTLEEAFNQAYFDYLMFSLQNTDNTKPSLSWFGPDPEKFMG